MKKYTYYVTVSADDKEQADKVINHRLNHDEDYGFAYRLNLSDAVPFDTVRGWMKIARGQTGK